MAKIYGELEQAGLQQIAATTATPAFPGRMYADITNPAAAIPKFHNGTTWLQMLTGQATALISQNSGLAITVDWSQGLYQQIILTNNAVISFTNPQSGSVHTLVVTQGATSGITTAWRHNFNMIDQDSKHGPYQPIGVVPVNDSAVYQWFYSAGIKPAYATVPNVRFAPATVAALASDGANDLSPDGKMLASPTATTPFYSFFPLFEANPKPSYGLRNYVVPTAAVAATLGAVYSPDGNFIFSSSGTTPFIQGFYLDRQVITGSAIANPGILPAGAASAIAMHPAGSFVGVGHATTPFMSIYPFTSEGYGTKLTNPSQLPDALVSTLAWSPQGDYLAALSQTSPFLRVWSFTASLGTTAFGGVAANPSPLPAAGFTSSGGKGIAWRPQGDFIAMAISSTPFLYVVPFSRAAGTFGTPLAVTAPFSAQATCVAWSPDGQYLLVGSTVTPWLVIYDFSAQTLATTVTFDSAGITQTVQDICINPSGDWATLIYAATPFYSGIFLPNKVRNYLRLTP